MNPIPRGVVNHNQQLEAMACIVCESVRGNDVDFYLCECQKEGK